MFFTNEMIRALGESDAAPLTSTQQRFFELHNELYGQVQFNNLDLHIITASHEAIQRSSVSDLHAENILSVAYLRSKGQAVNVERLMGREEHANTKNIEARRHLVMELRISQENLCLELIMSPDAWWDQQNLVGKLSIMRHKQDFYASLKDFNSEYRLGFWKGVHLSDMHLRAAHFQHIRIIDEWMSTFQANADWFRLGIWYDWDSELLEETRIVAELMKQIRLLYQLYTEIRWTSDNNFREFYSTTR